jgi:hypothetical protein
MKNLGQLIPPKVTTAERNIISTPDEGELIYNLDTDSYNYFDGIQWKNLIASGGNSPGDIGGGAASMVMSLASGSIKHVETGSGTYANLAHFIYSGSNSIGDIIKINVNSWVTGTSSCDIRFINKQNGDLICELFGVVSQDEFNIQDMGTITNLPTGPQVIEIQGRKNTGAGSSKLRIGSVELQY